LLVDQLCGDVELLDRRLGCGVIEPDIGNST